MSAIAVVVPTLDEARRLPALLADLAALGIAEVVVSDGGSTDGTTEIARRAGALVVSGPAGRGRQLDAGVRACRSAILWFLHADARPPADAPRAIARALADPGIVGGAFLTRTVNDVGSSWVDPLLPLADIRARFRRRPYGDQGLFCRRSAYVASGGFPDEVLFEDVELARRLAREGRLVILPQRLQVSGRRFVARPLRSAAAMLIFPVLYRLGVPPGLLAPGFGPVR